MNKRICQCLLKVEKEEGVDVTRRIQQRLWMYFEMIPGRN